MIRRRHRRSLGHRAGTTAGHPALAGLGELESPDTAQDSADRFRDKQQAQYSGPGRVNYPGLLRPGTMAPRSSLVKSFVESSVAFGLFVQHVRICRCSVRVKRLLSEFGQRACIRQCAVRLLWFVVRYRLADRFWKARARCLLVALDRLRFVGCVVGSTHDRETAEVVVLRK